MPPTKAQAEKKAQRALELHLAGASYSEIMRALQYTDRSGARRAVKRGLAARGPLERQPRDALETAVARLDAMLTSVWPQVRRGDLGAIDRVLRIEERRQALLGPFDLEDAPAEEATSTGKDSALSDFEQRLRERETARTSAARRAEE